MPLSLLLATSIVPSVSEEYRAAIAAEVDSDIPAIRYCYQRELPADPSLEGEIIVLFTIDRDGSVAEAKAWDVDPGFEAVSDCLLPRIERMEFPPTESGHSLQIRYPFHFEPGDWVPPETPRWRVWRRWRERGVQ